MSKQCFVGQGARLGRAGHTTPLYGSHPFRRHQPADIVGKVLQSDFVPQLQAVLRVLRCLAQAGVAYDAATWRGLLSTEHVLDAGPNSALLAVRVLLRLR